VVSEDDGRIVAVVCSRFSVELHICFAGYRRVELVDSYEYQVVIAVLNCLALFWILKTAEYGPLIVSYTYMPSF
jgi:ubiquinone biosynthesis protein UbiJ